jgi:hypothetical protein
MSQSKKSNQRPLSQSAKRQIRNEQVFRRANEKVQRELKKLEKMASSEGNDKIIPADKMVLQFYCECSDANCKERIAMTLSEYEKLHKDRSHFIVLPKHETKSIEKIVSKNDDYNVVDKFLTLSESPSQA